MIFSLVPLAGASKIIERETTLMKTIVPLLIGVLIATVRTGMAETTSFTCEYLKFSDQNGSHTEREPFRFSLLLDSDTRRAYLVGNNDSSELEYRAAGDRLVFIEHTASGNVLVTAIARDGQSVHSRHPFVGDKFLASQYYGRCVKK
jgi:hypothetical protein